MQRAIAICLSAFVLSAPAAAQTLDDIVQLEVLPGWNTGDGRHIAALAVDLAPGWKTYWRAPGDAGIPPQVTLSGSGGITRAELHWPVPEVFDQNGMRSVGYSQRLVLPIEIALSGAGGSTEISGTLDIGICEEVCIPVRMDFAATLPPQGRRDPAIVAALVNRPMSAADAGVTAVTCDVTPTDSGLSLTARVTVPSAGQREALVIEAGDPEIWVSEPDMTRDGGTITASVEMVHAGGAGFALDRSAVRFTLLGSSHAVDIRGCSAG